MPSSNVGHNPILHIPRVLLKVLDLAAVRIHLEGVEILCFQPHDSFWG